MVASFGIDLAGNEHAVLLNADEHGAGESAGRADLLDGIQLRRKAVFFGELQHLVVFLIHNPRLLKKLLT